MIQLARKRLITRDGIPMYDSRKGVEREVLLLEEKDDGKITTKKKIARAS